MRPRIDSYEFGRLVVDGKTYTSDVIIFPHGVKGGWWRKEGHRLCLEDLKEVLEEKPEVLVVGTGYSGLVEVPREVAEGLQAQGIKVVVEPTSKAVKTYNELSRSKKVVAALHLTC